MTYDIIDSNCNRYRTITINIKNEREKEINRRINNPDYMDGACTSNWDSRVYTGNL